MPSVRERNGKFLVELRKRGYPSVNKTFPTREEAERFIERSKTVDLHILAREVESERLLLGDLIDEYLEEVTPTKKESTQAVEAASLRRIGRHPLAWRSAKSLLPSDFAAYRKERLAQGIAAGTVRQELSLFSKVLDWARSEGAYTIDNPVRVIKWPASVARDRRPEPEELEAILAAAREHPSGELEASILIALETGMRQGNVAVLEWPQIRLKERFVFIRKARVKNGIDLTVPLSMHAAEILAKLPRRLSGRVFGWADGKQLSNAWAWARKRAEDDVPSVESLHFHDLRHEAASRLAPHVPATTLAKIMGWKNLSQALAYYNPTAAELVAARDRADAARAG